MEIAIILLIILGVNGTNYLEFEGEIDRDTKIDYYMSRLYIYPNLNTDGNFISELRWGNLFRLNLDMKYRLAWAAIKPIGNNRLEISIRLLDLKNDKFIESPYIIKFPEDYDYPKWMTVKSPQLIERIKRSIIDIDLETSPIQCKAKYRKNSITFSIKKDSVIGILSWNNFIKVDLIENIFADTIELILLNYRRLLITAYNATTPNPNYHVGIITFPEYYIFPYWFQHVNGYFYKSLINKYKVLNLNLTANKQPDELLIHLHSNVFRICIDPDYKDSVRITSVRIGNFKYNTSESSGIDTILIYKRDTGIDVVLTIGSNKYKKLSKFLPYGEELSPEWSFKLNENTSSRDDLYIVDLNIFAESLPNIISLKQDLNRYILEPKSQNKVRILAVSTPEKFHFLSPPFSFIKKITIIYLVGDFWKVQLDVYDLITKTTDEKWLFLYGKNYIKFLPPPNIHHLKHTS